MAQFLPALPQSLLATSQALAVVLGTPGPLQEPPRAPEAPRASRLTWATVTLNLLDTLSHLPNIEDVKDASGHTGRILTLLNRLDECIQVLSASAHIPLLVLQLGGAGWMAGPPA